MKHAQAVKIVTKCCDYYIQKKLAFDANMYERHPEVEQVAPYAKTAHDEREQIREALRIISESPKLL
jgi:hypothetical protein